MRLRQIFFAIAFITPLLTLPVDGLLFSSNEEALSPEVNEMWMPGMEWVDWRNGISYTTNSFEKDVWMTENFKGTATLMSYQEAVEAAPEGWRLPNSEEWERLFTTTGFTGSPNDLIPEAYYEFNFQSEGFNDPLVGLSSVNEAGMYWVESSEKDGNYITVPNRELKYKHGKTSKSAKMAVRYVKR